MTTRTRRRHVQFAREFSLRSAGRNIPAGSYEVLTDEELIEGLSFPVYRRVATFILVPGTDSAANTVEMLAAEPSELEVARTRGPDAASAT